VCLPGLDPDRRYRVQVLAPGGLPPAWGSLWSSSGPLTMTGRTLAAAGVQVAALWPEHLTMVEVTQA
jgi:alpha-galactosidase